MSFTVAQSSSDECAITNNIYMNNAPSYVEINDYIFKTSELPGDGNFIHVNLNTRKFMNTAVGDSVRVKPAFPTESSKMKLTISLKSVKKISISETDIVKALLGHVPTPGHVYTCKISGSSFTITIISVQDQGIVSKSVELDIIESGNITIVDMAPPKIFKSVINIEDLGIGGLGSEFLDVFRKVFASRMLSEKIRKELGIDHVRGLMLYGPPGTGKTLLAREIGKILNCKEPKIVNGPSLLNKYVGQSEENVRNLFADAIEDQKKGKTDLHLIICDEFDAIAQKRGKGGDSTGVGDKVVNSFLTMIDGVNALNNILIIAMTNRLELIDEALLRAGRFEVKIEIKLPTFEGRVEILKIHTREMRSSKRLADDVDLDKIASQTKNYSGAELAGLIRCATSYAISREISLDTTTTEKDTNPVVTMTDMERAIFETIPALGKSNDMYSRIVKKIDDSIFNQQTLEKVAEILTNIKQNKVFSILIVGKIQSCKTYLSCYIANLLGFSQVQMVCPSFSKVDISDVVGKCKTTTDSCLIVDDLEGILQWCDQGNVYDNTSLQAVRNACKIFINEDQRMVVVSNTSNIEMARRLNLDRIFSVILTI